MYTASTDMLFNNGITHSKVIDQQCMIGEHNGKWIATERVSLVALSCFRGTGLIQAPVISITVGKFDFTGTIDCSEKCVIYSTESFDQSQFKRVGKGVFEIIIKDANVKAEPQEDTNPGAFLPGLRGAFLKKPEVKKHAETPSVPAPEGKKPATTSPAATPEAQKPAATPSVPAPEAQKPAATPPAPKPEAKAKRNG